LSNIKITAFQIVVLKTPFKSRTLTKFGKSYLSRRWSYRAVQPSVAAASLVDSIKKFWKALDIALLVGDDAMRAF